MRARTILKKRLKLFAGRTIVYGSLLPELFCELFRTVDGRRGIQLLTIEIFGFETPDLVVYVAAGILAGLDFGSFLMRIDPTNDAKKIMGIESKPALLALAINNALIGDGILPSNHANDGSSDGEPNTESIKFSVPVASETTPLRTVSNAAVDIRPTQSGIQPIKILLGISTEGMIINASFINAIAVYHIALYYYSKGDISLDAAKLMIYILGGSIVATDIICNNFLSLKEGINSAESWVDFKHSPIYTLTQNNKKLALMAASKILVTNTFHGSVHYLVTKQFFWGVLPFATGLQIADSTTEYIGYSSAAAAFFTFTLLHANDFFDDYRAPFLRLLNEGPKNQYDFNLVSSNDRLQIWEDLSFKGKIKIALQPATHGLIRGGYVAFIVFAVFYHYVGCLLSSPLSQLSSIAVALIPFFLLFFQVYFAEKEHALNLRHYEIQTHDEPKIFSLPTQLSTLAFNFGSRAIRGFIALLSFHQMFGSLMGDQLATVLGLGIVLEVTLMEGALFQTAMKGRVESRGEDIKVAFNALRALSCASHRPGYSELPEASSVNQSREPALGQ